MIDYQTIIPTIQIVILIFQAIFAYGLLLVTKRYTIATEKYIGIAEKSLKATEDSINMADRLLKETIAERKIISYEKKLELLKYIYNYRSKFEEDLPCSTPAYIGNVNYIKEFVDYINPKTHLMDEPLRSNLEELLKSCPTGDNNHARKRREDYDIKKLKENILKQINEDIKKYESRLDELEK